MNWQLCQLIERPAARLMITGSIVADGIVHFLGKIGHTSASSVYDTVMIKEILTCK